MKERRDHARDARTRRELHELAQLLVPPAPPRELERTLRALHPRAGELPDRELRAIIELTTDPDRD